MNKYYLKPELDDNLRRKYPALKCDCKYDCHRFYVLQTAQVVCVYCGLIYNVIDAGGKWELESTGKCIDAGTHGDFMY